MEIGFIGLGRMGKNMVLQLLEKKHRVVVYDRSPEAVRALVGSGVRGCASIGELVLNLKQPRIIWLMITAGKPIDDVLRVLTPDLKRGDIVIDGGNSFYQDSIRRSRALVEKGVIFMDVGTSGGIDGARRGACMMVGGSRPGFKRTETLYRDLCVPDGYGYMGRSGAGHFVKMVHNGIEYGMMAAIAEGLQAVQQYSKQFGISPQDAARVYAHGSIIQSRLMDWALRGMKREGFKKISGAVPLGETEAEMKTLERLARMPILYQARKGRAASRKSPTFAGKLIAVMRNEFGGHRINSLEF